MKVALNPILLIFTLLLASGPLTATAWSGNARRDSSLQDSSDDTAVRSVLKQLTDGWKSADGKAVAATFTEDGDLVAGDGTYKKGRSEIAQYMQLVFDKVFVGGRVAMQINSLRFLSGNVALVHAKGGILIAGETEVPPDRLGFQTFVVTKQSGRWLIATFQNTRIQPFPR